MVAVHHTFAVLVLLATVAAVVVGTIALRRRQHGRVLNHLLALAQTLLIAQVGIGLLLLSEHHRAAHRLHYLYGTLALLAVLSPWMYAPPEPRSRLIWFVGATLLAALLAGRAFMTA